MKFCGARLLGIILVDALLLTVLGAAMARGQSPAASERVQPIRIDRRHLAMPDSVRARMLHSLAAGRARWRAARPAGYQLAVTVGCFCPPRDSEPKQPVALVHGMRITGVRPATHDEAKVSLLVWKIWSVDSLFVYAERELQNRNTRITTLVLDQQYGFPRKVVSDVPWITDSHFAVLVQLFVSHP